MHFIDVLHFQYQIISSAGRQPWKPIEKIQWNLFIVQGVLAVKCFSLCFTLQDDVQEDVGIWEEPTRQASSLPMSDSFVCWVNGASYRCRISGIWLDGSFPMCAFVAVLYLRVPVCAGVFCMNVCQVQRTVSVQEDVDNREDGLTAVPKGGWPPPVVHWICVCDASLKYLNNPVHWSMEHIPMCVCNAQLLTSALDVFCNVFKKELRMCTSSADRLVRWHWMMCCSTFWWWISPNVCLSCASSTSQRTTTFESQGWLTTGHLQVSDVFVQRSVFKFNAIGSHWRQASPNNQPFSKLALQTSSMAFEHESNRKSWFFSADDGNHCVFNIWSTAEPFGPWH